MICLNHSIILNLLLTRLHLISELLINDFASSKGINLTGFSSNKLFLQYLQQSLEIPKNANRFRLLTNFLSIPNTYSKKYRTIHYFKILYPTHSNFMIMLSIRNYAKGRNKL